MEPKWVVIYIAHSENSLHAAQALLASEGFLCRANPMARSGHAGEVCYEVSTLKSEAQEARDALQEQGF